PRGQLVEVPDGVLRRLVGADLAGDVTAVIPLPADVAAPVAPDVVDLEGQVAVERLPRLQADVGRLRVDLAHHVEQAGRGHQHQDQGHQGEEAQEPPQHHLEALDRLGEDGVDGLVADVGGDAEG